MKGEEQLREELNEFQKEKERIRSIVGEIGGSTNRHNKVINNLLIIIIVTLLLLGGVFNRITPGLAIQIAILFGIIKLIWMFYEAQRASHFQFWILNSLEYRINEIHKKIKKIDEELDKINNKNI